MRKSFARAIVRECNFPDCFFLTGDLGFMALEEVRASFGTRFINCGVAEQNMVSVAAGLAREGLRCFVYSIAPFVYARPYEQIRNDVCFGDLSLCLVGNGGGYAYGHMGPTHHALEDCAALSALGVRCMVPAFDEDIGPMIQSVGGPCYLRLGYDVRPEGSAVPAWRPWRMILFGGAGCCVALGPLAGLAWSVLAELPEERRPALWACTELPIAPLPGELYASVRDSRLVVIEEHHVQGGLGMALSYALLKEQCLPRRMIHRYALGYPSKRYGSQTFHRTECGLDARSLHDLFAGNAE